MKGSTKSRKLTRVAINTICDSIQPVPSLDPVASHYSSINVVERFRDQLTKVEMIQKPETIASLVNYINKRQGLAFIKDDTNVGLPASEEGSASIAQASQSLFKATGHDVSLTTVVNQMSSVLSTVTDRSDQKVTVHFDPFYAPNRKNYSLKEIVDMRALFPYTTLQDIIIPDGVKTGIIGNFEGDGLNADMKRIKEEYINEFFAPVMEPKPWNKVYTIRNGKIGIICMRIRLDSQLMYSRNITMSQVINGLSGKTEGMSVSICASSMQEGIVDVLSKYTSKLTTNDIPHILAGMDRMKRNFGAIGLSGLPKVQSMSLSRVDILKLFVSYGKAEQYHVSNLGMKLWLAKSDLKDLTWKNIENKVYLVSEDEKNEEGFYELGYIGDDLVCVYSTNNLPDYEKPTEDELTDLYVQYYCINRNPLEEADFNELWVINLDALSMKINCVDMQLVDDLLDFCGIDVIGHEKSRTSELIEYIYVKSKTNPKDIIDRHFQAKSYTKENLTGDNEILSANAIDMVNKSLLSQVSHLTPEKKENFVDSILRNIEVQFLNRISKYYYAILNVSKKEQGKEKGPIVEHVVSHVYSEIIRYPFVSREKTTCNDWHTMCYVLGADAAKNNYILEPGELFASCDIKMDPRHLELLADYVFERGTAAGIGLIGLAKHGVGIMHEISIKKPYQQLAAAHLRGAESAAHYSTSTVMGTVPRGIGTKEREVEQFKKMEEMERATVLLRYGQNKNVKIPGKGYADNSDAVGLAVRSTLLETDPYFGIPTITIKNAKTPKYLGELETPSTIYSYKILNKVTSVADLDAIYARLKLSREYTGHIKKIITLETTCNILDMDKLYTFFTQNANTFS
jgi:hypothetical protein